MRAKLEALLARVSRKRSIGLVVGDESVTVSRVVHTSLGSLEVSRETTPMGGEPVESAVRNALRPLLEHKEWRRAPMAVGLPTLRLLFLARPVPTVGREVSGHALLHESLQLTNVLVDDLAVSMRRGVHGKRAVACLLATRRRYLEPVLEAITAEGIHPHTVEPSAFGLLRLAAKLHPQPRKSKAVLRVFLGPSSGLLVIATGDRPMFWRGFDLPSGGADAAIPAISTAVGSARHLASRAGLDEPPDVLMIHGRPDLGDLASASSWGPSGPTARHLPGPSLDDDEAAGGVAAACHGEEDGFNLAPHLKPQMSLGSLFPWFQAAIEAAVLAVATAMLGGQMMEIRTQSSMMHARAEQFTWLRDRSIEDLEKEKAELTVRVDAIRSYLSSRFHWTNYAHEVASQLPPSMSITNFAGTCMLPSAVGKEKSETGRKSLVLEIETPVGGDGDVPPDIQALLDNMRGVPLLKKSLPVIRMSGLKWGKSRNAKSARSTTASFTLSCEPQGKSKKAGEKT